MTQENLNLALARLSADELRKVKSQVTLLLGSDDAASSDDEVWVHGLMDQALRDHGAVSVPPLSVVRKARHYSDFKEGCQRLLQVVSLLSPRSRTERVKAAGVLLKMLCRHVRDKQVPLTHKTLVQATLRTAEVVDVRFPGYRESGLLPALLRGIS